MLTTTVVVLCACVAVTLACSCWPETGPERFCKYPVVVRGVTKAEWQEREEPIYQTDPWYEFYQMGEWVYSVEIEDAIILPSDMKKNTTILIRTPTQDSMCGVRFPLDTSIVFFGWVNQDGVVHTGLCDPSTRWENLNDFQRELVTEHLPEVCEERAKGIKPPQPPPNEPRTKETSMDKSGYN